MNNVANPERIHIAIVGKKNVGKSSLINCLTNQKLSIVSETPGTTIDPIRKAVELIPYGPVVIVDTAGIDDKGDLCSKRIGRTIKSISKADIVIIVLDAREELDNSETELITYLQKIEVPFLAVVNKIEFGINPHLLTELEALEVTHFEVSCKENAGVDIFKKKLIHLLPSETAHPLISDLVGQGDLVLMVMPNNLDAVKGRLQKLQVHTIREALDGDTISVAVKDKELKSALASLKHQPDLVISDSQAIVHVSAIVPVNVKLTTFSILMARHKGNLPDFVNGLKKVMELKNGDKVLISEACTHQAQDDDIGTVVIPLLLKKHTKKNLQIDTIHGYDFPENLSEYKLVVHCDGCMLTRKEMQVRIKQTKLVGIPIVNYGLLISYMNGVIPRVILPFKEAYAGWEKAILT